MIPTIGRYRDFPFLQRIRGRHPIQPSFFEDEMEAGRLELGDTTGLIEDLSLLQCDRFDPGRVAGNVREFYEYTARYLVFARNLRWHNAVIATAYAASSRALGNLAVPQSLPGEVLMGSQVRRLDLGDGQESRVWIRTFPHVAKTFYLAAVRSFVREDASYLNLTFPFPGGALVVILGLTNTARGGISLRTDVGGVAGTYFIKPLRGGRFARLPGPPTEEVISMEPNTDPDPSADELIGLHVDSLFGREAFRLDYRFRRKE